MQTPNQHPMQIHRGKIIRKGDRYFMIVHFRSDPTDIEIPIEDLFEEFENEGLELTMCPKHFGSPLWKKLVPDWDT